MITAYLSPDLAGNVTYMTGTGSKLVLISERSSKWFHDCKQALKCVSQEVSLVNAGNLDSLLDSMNAGRGVYSLVVVGGNIKEPSDSESYALAGIREIDPEVPLLYLIGGVVPSIFFYIAPNVGERILAVSKEKVSEKVGNQFLKMLFEKQLS